MLINQHATKTLELADAHRRLANARGALIMAGSSAWNRAMHTPSMSVTERREAVRHSTANLQAVVESELGEVEALKVELNGLEWEMRMHAPAPIVSSNLEFLHEALHAHEDRG